MTRPAWYYDVTQQGEGIADVTTHLIDLAAWKCFPGSRSITATMWRYSPQRTIPRR
ncbi:MAG: putative oxidoreductase C-terminal domain-containing protein [Alistipes indistinctus]